MAALTLALRNRVILTPAVERGEPAATRALGRAVRAEIVIGLMVLALRRGLPPNPAAPGAGLRGRAALSPHPR